MKDDLISRSTVINAINNLNSVYNDYESRSRELEMEVEKNIMFFTRR